LVWLILTVSLLEAQLFLTCRQPIFTRLDKLLWYRQWLSVLRWAWSLGAVNDLRHYQQRPIA